MSETLDASRNTEHKRLTPAVLRACDILDLLADSNEPMRVGEIARLLELPRNSVYELVNTLSSKGMARIDTNGRVSLGIRLFELGSVFSRSLDLVKEADPVVREVVRSANEATHVGILEGRHVVYLIKVEGTHPVQILSAVGRQIPAHGTAIGKAILAFQPREETLTWLRGARLERLTPKTITDTKALVADLDRAVADGFTIDDEECMQEVSCVGAPIYDAGRRVIAAMSIAAPSSRINQERRRELAALVMEGARALSRRLGHVQGLATPHVAANRPDAKRMDTRR